MHHIEDTLRVGRELHGLVVLEHVRRGEHGHHFRALIPVERPGQLLQRFFNRHSKRLSKVVVERSRHATPLALDVLAVLRERPREALAQRHAHLLVKLLEPCHGLLPVRLLRRGEFTVGVNFLSDDFDHRSLRHEREVLPHFSHSVLVQGHRLVHLGAKFPGVRHEHVLYGL